MQIKGDGSKTCAYFIKGLDYLLERSEATNEASKDQSMEASNEASYEASIKHLNNHSNEALIKLCLIGTTTCESQTWLRSEVKKAAEEGRQVMVVVLNYYRDSMISLKYIENSLHRQIKSWKVKEMIALEFNEQDAITAIEDAYDQSYSYRRLSRRYKKVLKTACDFSRPKEEKKKSLKTARRKEYADSPLV